MIAVAMLAGYLLGSIPSADWVARAVGLDLRRQGTRNPGTANAIGLGGVRLGVPILVLDFLKGIGAVAAGLALAGQWGGVAGGLAAAVGQIANPWFRFRGGKGLAVGGGVALALLPAVALAIVPVFALLSRFVRPAALAVLIGLVATTALAAATASLGAPWNWGPVDGGQRVAAIGALTLLLTPKFGADVLDRAESVGLRRGAAG